MGYASYERQQLALYAAGHIFGDGSSPAAFGCGLTRIGVGIYAVVLGNDDGLVDGESYVFVTAKFAAGQTGLLPGISPPDTRQPIFPPTVEDTSNTIKTIFTYGLTLSVAGVTFGAADLPAGGGLEIALYRSVTK